MTKAEIIKEVSRTTGLTNVQSDAAVNATLRAISEGLLTDGKVQFIGFGTFKLVSKEARVGRNPQTGQPLQISAKTVLKFVPSK